MGLFLLCIGSGQNKAGGQKVPLSPQQVLWDPPNSHAQGGCCREVGWNVGGWRAPGGGPGSTSALVALRSQEAGQGGV